MWESLKSLLIWCAIALLVLIWLPLMAVIRLFDRDPAHYYTGKFFRKLGKTISRINPNWQLSITGKVNIDDRRPYVVVCNHLSQADIPLISNLPWEMKWVAKKILFDTPVVGWMMKLAGDISVDRQATDRKERTLDKASYYLDRQCSVMFFPEGTRSRNGKLNAFTRGAFKLAIREDVPVLPLVIDGTQNTLPKRSWKFGIAKHIKLRVLPPVSVEKYEENQARSLSQEVRGQILNQLAEWRNQPADELDNLAT
ncbi:1-acyl-sn-glycerol-3-phosphate acyltransferase [Fodinibius salinus]|uniref:1-acyl-sn-glycerol-3-phosphate acyltransferase n=1 Tax=Fodinibius salinus TaxID=860790 RepID=A0A5D3YQR7_9BACT|nr:lysophospholipid acyltransferase family protein [Fodinibius salinus]TYP95333.1 1-acyl-sn-glycerol-3-phosphate acyltransferase [Fodinibius salinus]